MDASHFTESSVLLSCFFKQTNTGCSQSQVNGTDSTVIVIQIKPTYNNNNNLIVFYAMILLKFYNHDRNDSIVFGKTQNYVSTSKIYFSSLLESIGIIHHHVAETLLFK